MDNVPTSAKKPGFFELYEEFKFEMKQLFDFLVLTSSKNGKIYSSHLYKMSEFLEELLNQHVSLLSRFEKLENQHFFELKELKLSLKNRNKQKKTTLKMQLHQLETLVNTLRQDLDDRNRNIADLRTSFDENLKSEKKLQRTMESWFKRQFEKVQLSLQELQQGETQTQQTIASVLHKIQKYQNNFPWNWRPSNISGEFSIATTPYSNYSVLSLNSQSKSPEKSLSNLNRAFCIISSQKQQEERTPKNLFKDTMTVTQKEQLLLQLIKENPTQDTEYIANQRHSVKLEDILNVTKKSNGDSSLDCEFLKEVQRKKKIPPNSLEKLLKTLDFTGKLSDKHQENDEELILTNKNIVKDLNREIYRHFGETLNLSQSSVNSLASITMRTPKEKNKELIYFQEEENAKQRKVVTNSVFNANIKLKKVPKLNLEKVVNKEEGTHSFSPSYRKNAERSQYLKQMFQEKQIFEENRKGSMKRVKQTNKSMDFSSNNNSNNSKPMNLKYLQWRINDKTNKFINNLFQNPRKHAKNNYSMIENSNFNKDELSFINNNNKNNIRINELLQKNENPQNTLTDKTNFLNIVAPTNNINVYIGAEYEEKERDNKPKKKGNRLMKLLSQVNQNRKEGRLMKENIPGEREVCIGNIQEFSVLQKMRNLKKK